MEQDIRWKQRFENFGKAVALFNEIETLDIAKLSFLEKEGIIQRFEYTLELAWKTLKDKMEFDGLILDKIAPKVVLKEAYSAKYLDHIEIWLQMIDDRNLLSHSYNFETFEKIIADIQTKYIKTIGSLHAALLAQL